MLPESRPAGHRPAGHIGNQLAKSASAETTLLRQSIGPAGGEGNILPVELVPPPKHNRGADFI